MSDIPEIIEELPKEVVAKSVISDKRLYFLSDYGVSIDATSPEEAARKYLKTIKAKDGDGL
jgi:hypothetical protein